MHTRHLSISHSKRSNIRDFYFKKDPHLQKEIFLIT
jgi:hypothetical protein